MSPYNNSLEAIGVWRQRHAWRYDRKNFCAGEGHLSLGLPQSQGSNSRLPPALCRGEDPLTSLIDRLSEHIKDPRFTTSMSRYWPRSGPLVPTAAPAVVDAAEASFGFVLPPLLHAIYTHVANGGFGPGYGIYGLEGGYLRKDPHGQDVPPATLVEAYFACEPMGPSLTELQYNFRRDGAFFLGDEPGNPPLWPRQLIEICGWGDDLYSCIDCSNQDYPVLVYIAYGGQIHPQSPTFSQWIQDWLDDRLELSLE